MFASLSTGQTLAFDRYGETSAPPVVLLHGLSDSRLGYRAVVEHLRHRWNGLQILNVDLRGHGESSRADLDTYDAQSYADDIAAFISEHIRRPAIVVGHSLGGVVAASLGASHPDLVTALFLEDPPFGEGNDEVRNASPVAAFFPKMISAVKELQARNADAASFARLAETTHPSERADRCETLRRWDSTTMQAAIDGIVWRNFNPAAILPMPVTILRADPVVGAVFSPTDVPIVQAANPHADIVMVPHASHGIHDAPTRAAYLDQLDRFLGQQVQMNRS